MKRNLIALFAVLVLGAITFWLIYTHGNSSIRQELRDFAVKDTASVTKIFLADNTPRQVTLTRQKDNSWLVDGKYVARPDAIKNLLRVVHDLTVRNPVGLKARDHVLRDLGSGAVKIEIYNGDDMVKSYYVGHETQDAMGTFMLLIDQSTGHNSTEPFEMEIKGFNGYLTPYYFTSAKEWRDRTVFHYYVPNIRSIRVDHYGQPGQSFVITQAQGSKIFTLKNGEGQALPFDTMAIKQYISYYGQLNFENFEDQLTAAQRDSVLRTPPAHVISVTDADGKTNVVKMFLKKRKTPPDPAQPDQSPWDPDRMYGLVNNGKDFVLIQYYVFGKLLMTPEYFLQKQNVVK